MASRDALRHSPPGKLVDIGGRRLHIYCTGTGSPTVVMDAGGGGSSLDWSWVQPEVAKFTRVCTYDRAGFGWSDPGPLPRTSARIVQELHQLLLNAGIAPPFVLVGHSLGGMNVRLYASQFPHEVVGLVLVDAAHEKAYAQFPAQYQKLLAAQLRMLRLGWLTAHVGLPRLLKKPMSASKLPPNIQPMADALGFRPKAYRAALDEALSLAESVAQLHTATFTLRDMPLVVLTAQISREGLPGDFPVVEMNRIWMEAQTTLANLSSNSRHIIAQNSGHFIHIDRPELVIEAVRHVVEQARAVQ